MYIVISLNTLIAKAFKTAADAAISFWGNDPLNLLVVKNEEKVIKIVATDIDEIEKQLENA